MNEWARISRGVGLTVGAVAGATAVLNTARILAERATVNRIRRLGAQTTYDDLGVLPVDRRYTVTAQDGTPLYVQEVGPKDAPVVVVFAHGYALNLTSFHFQVHALAALEDPRLRLVLFDQRSHGQSGRSARADCTIDQLGADLEQVITAATDGSQQVVLVGHSMGGMTIMGLADRAPELFGSTIASVVLISTSAGNLMASMRAMLPTSIIERTMPILARGAQLAPRSLERARPLLANAAWLAIRRFSFGDKATPAALSDFADQMIGATPVDVIADFYRTLAGHDKVEALPALAACEVLIICGDADRITPIQHSALLFEHLPKAQFAALEGAGHLVQLEQPEQVNSLIIELIQRSTRRSKRRTSS